MKELSLEERKAGFDEVEKGLARHQALPEASRCLFCHERRASPDVLPELMWLVHTSPQNKKLYRSCKTGKRG